LGFEDLFAHAGCGGIAETSSAEACGTIPIIATPPHSLNATDTFNPKPIVAVSSAGATQNERDMQTLR